MGRSAAPGPPRRARLDARLRRSAGRPDLREQLALYLTRARGAVADPERVVLCCGFRHGLSLVSRALHARGARRIAIEEPCAPPHRAAAAASGARLVPLPVDERGARTDLLYTLRVAAAVVGPAHQFPLGVVMQPDHRAAAIEWARASGGFVIEDDYDAELRYDRQPVGSLQALAPERVAYGGTASKTLIPGLRLGWLLLPTELLEPVLELRAVEDVHVGRPTRSLSPSSSAPAPTTAMSGACARATAPVATSWSACWPSGLRR